MNEKQFESVDGRLSRLVPEDRMNNIRLARPHMIKADMDRLLRLISDSKSTIELLEKALSQGDSWAASRVDEAKKTAVFAFMLPNENAYPIVNVELFGLTTAEMLKNKSDVNSKVLEVLSWSKKRIEAIEKEALELKEKAPEPQRPPGR